MRPTWPNRIVRMLGNAMIVIFALAALGCLLPAIPLLGEIGPLLISPFGPWISVISLFGAVLLTRRWQRVPGRGRLVMAALAGFAFFATVWVQSRQNAVARANGVDISIPEAFLAHSQADDTSKPVTVFYSRYAGQDLPLDIYRPAPARHGAPVFIYVHGGGWGAETLKQRQADYRWFAMRGYLVISVEYPLSSKIRPTWNVAEPQLGCALNWIGANAARFGGDTRRIALWGESAGGNLVLNLAYRTNGGTMQPACAGSLPRIAAVAALYPVVDPARMYRNPDPLIGVFGRTMTTNYTGGTPTQFPERYAAISSSSHIGPKAPPTLLIVPAADHLVVPEAATTFAERAKAAGVNVQHIVMPYAEHSFDLRSGSIGNQFVRQAMLAFLEKHGLKP